MKTNPKKTHPPGFALIVTLSLMILLTVIAVGLLSLSSISLRVTGQTSAESIARNNARLAMMLALGELQKTLGTDTSVSAPASSVMNNSGRPHITGVWQRETNPSDPTDPGKDWHWTPAANAAPTYSVKKNLFKGWLVSSANYSDTKQFDFPKNLLAAADNVVSLVGNETNPLDNNGVSTMVNAEKVAVGNGTSKGKLAWTVFDESTKAPIDLGDPAAQTDGLEIASRGVPSRVRADILANNLADALRMPKNLISLDTAVVAGGTDTNDNIKKRFHDFTTNSLGLLTDTANGGLKNDLTSLFEEGTASLPSGLFFQSNGTTAATSPFPSAFTATAPSWAYIRDHYRKYKTVAQSGGQLSYKIVPSTDLKIASTGINNIPVNERLIPIIAKFQLIFSVVSHYAHIGERVQWLNSATAVPQGNEKHAVPHLAYDPVVTLYNPYDVALDLTKVRIRVWDPPVGFRFKKIDKQKGTSVYFRPGGEFMGLARFTARDENNAAARKCFTLVLADGNQAAITNRLLLMPGEVKVFSPRVEDNWTWQKETASEWEPRSFFDWGTDRNFSNIDRRSPSGIGQFGVECIPGWQSKAGLQTDHLSYGGRPAETLYDFEKLPGAKIGGFLSMRLTDDVTVEAKPLVTKGNATKNNFQVDILAGLIPGNVDAINSYNDTNNMGVSADTIRSYNFIFANAADPSAEMSETPVNSIVSRTWPVSETLQRPVEPNIPGTSIPGPGKKKVFAMLELSARATNDPLTDSKPWLYNNPIVEGANQQTSIVGLSNQSYDLRFRAMQSISGFPDGIDFDPDSNNGYFGASSARQDGSSFVHMMHVPAAPAASLGDLIHSNLVSGAALPRVVHALGNSRAHPLIPTSAISRSLNAVTMLDHSYLLNDSLWDKYYFSSITDYRAPLLTARTREDVLKGVLAKTTPALNGRLTPITSTGDPTALAEQIDGLGALPRSKELAKYLGVAGAFNLSSTSVDAWRAVLSSLRDHTVNGGEVSPSSAGRAGSVRGKTYENPNKTPFVRAGRPLAPADSVNSIRWAGYRSLSDDQITQLAASIVKEITKRGVEDEAPAFSVGEFVNRRLGTATDLHALAGLLQVAIDNTDINKEYKEGRSGQNGDGKKISAASIAAVRKKGVSTAEVMDGWTCEGAPSMLTQGDLMNALAPIATVRGDTFKIRSYGEANTADGTKVLARAWCEVVVQRVPEFVDSKDSPETRVNALTSTANINFGRRFNVVSFRWLNESEI